MRMTVQLNVERLFLCVKIVTMGSSVMSVYQVISSKILTEMLSAGNATKNVSM